jgi:L-alanine-DL-glutamate epimerase-like enolase superfamily enzyme
VPFDCRTSRLRVVDGRIKVPTGPGFAVDIDLAFVAKHLVVTA